MSAISAKITAVGGYVPDEILSNADLEKMVDTTDEWIRTRTGIVERRIMGKGKGVSDILVPAVNQILEKSGTKPEEVELVIVATVTADYVFPAAANLLSYKCGLNNAFSYDLSAACSSFLYAMEVGRRHIESGQYKKVIVAGADKMSSIIDYEDRATCVIFGDGGGAVMLEPDTEEGLGIQDAILKSDGSGWVHLHQKAGGSVMPPTHETIDQRLHYVYQEGKQVFKFAVTRMAEVSAQIMERNNLSSNDVDWLIPHQANLRIIDATRERMGLDPNKVTINIEKFGNTTSGTLPLCMWEWEDKFKKGDDIILAAFGGGFTWGSMYIKWGYDK